MTFGLWHIDHTTLRRNAARQRLARDVFCVIGRVVVHDQDMNLAPIVGGGAVHRVDRVTDDVRFVVGGTMTDTGGVNFGVFAVSTS